MSTIKQIRSKSWLKNPSTVSLLHKQSVNRGNARTTKSIPIPEGESRAKLSDAEYKYVRKLLESGEELFYLRANRVRHRNQVVVRSQAAWIFPYGADDNDTNSTQLVYVYKNPPKIVPRERSYHAQTVAYRHARDAMFDYIKSHKPRFVVDAKSAENGQLAFRREWKKGSIKTGDILKLRSAVMDAAKPLMVGDGVNVKLKGERAVGSDPFNISVRKTLRPVPDYEKVAPVRRKRGGRKVNKRKAAQGLEGDLPVLNYREGKGSGDEDSDTSSQRARNDTRVLDDDKHFGRADSSGSEEDFDNWLRGSDLNGSHGEYTGKDDVPVDYIALKHYLALDADTGCVHMVRAAHFSVKTHGIMTPGSPACEHYKLFVLQSKHSAWVEDGWDVSAAGRVPTNPPHFLEVTKECAIMVLTGRVDEALSGSHGEWTNGDDVVSGPHLSGFFLPRLVGAVRVPALRFVSLRHKAARPWKRRKTKRRGRRARRKRLSQHSHWQVKRPMEGFGTWRFVEGEVMERPVGPEGIVGAGLINAKVKNSGTGGNSKVPRDPKPFSGEHPKAPKVKEGSFAAAAMSGAVEVAEADPGKQGREERDNHPHARQARDLKREAQLYEAMEDVIEKERILGLAQTKALKDAFLTSGRSLLEARFSSPERLANSVVNDAGGAPFCGLNAIDVALGIKPDVNEYIRLARMTVDPWEIVGTPAFLGRYANSQGANLVIFNSAGARLHVSEPCATNRWIQLVFMAENERFVNGQIEDNPDVGVDDESAKVGHYLYLSHNHARDEELPLATLPERIPIRFNNATKIAVGLLAAITIVCLPHMGLAAMLGIKSAATVSSWFVSTFESREELIAGQRWLPRNNYDVRNVVDRRERAVFQDSYREVNHDYVVTLFLKEFRASTYLPDSVARDWSVGNFTVSELRFNAVYQEMQSAFTQGIEPNKALATLNRLREVNTDANMSSVLAQTGEVLDVAQRILFSGRTVISQDRRGLVAVNARNDRAILNNVDNAVANQVVGAGGKELVPFVVKYKIDKAKVGVPVAVAPIGPIVTDKGPLGPGLISVTDSPGVLAAFVERSMGKEPLDTDAYDDFLECSTEFLDHYLDRTDVSGLVEPDRMDYFREFYKGKKSATYIEQTLAEYERYLNGEMSRSEVKRYKQHSCFVKFESNVKLDLTTENGKLRVKPRLIMVMASDMLVELCRVTELFHKWNEGPFGRLQVKGLSVPEMADIISAVQNGRHCVTDFSSFESSVNYIVRKLENHAIRRLLEKAGYLETLRYFNQHMTGSRQLRTKWGVFEITTRCSGDFWTSFGNGIVNACVQWYGARSKGYTLEEFEHSVIVEGDDGLVKADLLNIELSKTIGFKISSELEGTEAGDTDFLRSRWINGKRLLNVGRSLSVLWVKNGAKLRKGKQCFILKCMAMSMHQMSPGHPILFELVNRIGKLCGSASDFTGSSKYVATFNNGYKIPDIKSYPRNVTVDESLRELVASGAAGFPPISITEQLVLEKRIREDDVIYLGSLLEDYDDVLLNKRAVEETGDLASDSRPLEELLEAKGFSEVLTVGRVGKNMFEDAVEPLGLGAQRTWAE